MKTLIVAHPDDEMLWFPAKEFDKIIICFSMRRIDKTERNEQVYKTLQEHPLRNRIEAHWLTSGKLWIEPTEFEKFIYAKNEMILREILKEQIEKSTEIYTHNEWGEYGHSDHILIHKIVKEMAKCPVWCWNGIERKHRTTGKERKHIIDMVFYKKVKDIYLKNDCWTWKREYFPLSEQEYFLC